MQPFHKGWYGGIGAGRAKADAECFGQGCDRSSTAAKVLGGFEFHRRFALELGYTDLGSISTGGEQRSQSAWEFTPVWRPVIVDRFSVHGRFGPFVTDDDLSLTIALGAAYDPHPALQVRVEYQRYFAFGWFSNFDVDLISAGLLWRF